VDKRKREYDKKYRKEHPEQSKNYSRKYYYGHIEERRSYRRKNVEKTRIYNKKYFKEYKNEKKEYDKQYYKEHLERKKKQYKDYIKKHLEIRRKCSMKYNRKIRNTIKGQIDSRISSLVRYTLRGTKAGRSWKSIVDFTLEQFKQHFQGLFTNGMNWNKFMNGEIHIDHVVPINHFHYESTDDPQFKECWALHNLQSMWARDNLSKGNRRYQLPLPL